MKIKKCVDCNKEYETNDHDCRSSRCPGCQLIRNDLLVKERAARGPQIYSSKSVPEPTIEQVSLAPIHLQSLSVEKMVKAIQEKI